MATVTRTFELSEEAAEELDRYAQREGRTPGRCVEDMLMMLHIVTDEDFTPEEWKLIQAGEAEADAGNFATQDELTAVLHRFRPTA